MLRLMKPGGMMDKLDDKSRAEIVFVGSTLGPLFLA